MGKHREMTKTLLQVMVCRRWRPWVFYIPPDRHWLRLAPEEVNSLELLACVYRRRVALCSAWGSFEAQRCRHWQLEDAGNYQNSKVRGLRKRHWQCLLHKQRRSFLSQWALKTQAQTKHAQHLPPAPLLVRKERKATEKYQGTTFAAIYILSWCTRENQT